MGLCAIKSKKKMFSKLHWRIERKFAGCTSRARHEAMHQARADDYVSDLRLGAFEKMNGIFNSFEASANQKCANVLVSVNSDK
jgi:hypothetical protein